MEVFSQFAATGTNTPHISIAAEEIFSVAGLSITNSMILGIVGYALLVWAFVHAARAVKHGKKKTLLDKVLIWGYEGLYSTVQQIVGDREMAKKIAPLPISMFFFIIMQYWLGIIPFVGPIMIDGTPLFRGLAADLNVTFALAIMTMVAAQLYAIKVHGAFGNLGRYLRNPLKDPAGAFEGILELIAEFSRLVGLSFRLFGNVFAGEVLLVIIAFLTSYAAVIALPPFYIFELFIGLIQAYIFFMLTTVFISLGLASHGHDAHPTDHSPVVKPTLAEGDAQ